MNDPVSHGDIALEFVRRFAAGDIAGVGALLDDDLRLVGPHLSVQSRAAYMDALDADPPGRCAVEIISVCEGQNQVAVFYDYLKPEGQVTVAQWFRLRGGKIVETRIVF